MGEGGGQVKFYPFTKGGCGKGFSHAEGEGKEVVSTWELEVFSHSDAGHIRFPPFKRGERGCKNRLLLCLKIACDVLR